MSYAEDLRKMAAELVDNLGEVGDVDDAVLVLRGSADEIERLRAKVKRLEARGITDMQHEIERLRAALEEAEDGPCDETGDWTMRCGECANCIIRRALDGEA